MILDQFVLKDWYGKYSKTEDLGTILLTLHLLFRYILIITLCLRLLRLRRQTLGFMDLIYKFVQVTLSL